MFTQEKERSSYVNRNEWRIICFMLPVTVISVTGSIFLFTDSRENDMICVRVCLLFAIV